MKKPKRAKWYKIYNSQCPVCFGGVKNRRTAQYDRKPKDPKKRYVFESVWDGPFMFYEFSDNNANVGFSGKITLKETPS